MAEDIIYEQIESGGDPDPLGLRKKMAAQKPKESDPLGLRTRLNSTSLSPLEEKGYQTWKSGLPENLRNETDYDLRGLYKSNPNVKPSANLHFQDTYKKPNHITFSEESIYNNPKKGVTGGKWANENGQDIFYASEQNIKNAGGELKLQDYFKRNEPNVKLVLPSKFTPMSDWLAIAPGYTPMVPENEVNSHTEKVKGATERVKAHLNDMDESVRNLIYEHKKDLQGRLKSQELAINPRFEAAPINPQAQQLESDLRQDVPVYDDEVNEFKSGMTQNQTMLRQGLAQKVKDLDKKDKKSANQLKADIYRVDAQERKDKEAKIDKNIEKIDSGEYDYDVVRGELVKPEGFFSSLATGYKDKVKAFDDYEVFKRGDEKEMLELINKRLKYDPDEARPTPNGIDGEAGVMLGGQPLKPLIGGGIAGYFSGGLGATTAAAAISAPEMYKLTFGAMLPHNFEGLKAKHPELSDSEVLQMAVDLTNDQANVDALSGAAMGALGAKAGFKPTGLNAGLLKKSIGSALTQLGETAAKKTLEGLGVGSVGAAGQMVKNLMAQKEGLRVDETEGMAQQLLGGVGMTIGMTMVAKFPELIKPKTYNQLLQSFKGVPKEIIEENLNQLQEVGQITPEQAQKAQTEIQNHQAIDNSIQPNVPEADRLKVQEKIKQRNELESSLETTDKAYHPEIKEKIKSLNEEIVNISKGVERGDLQKLIDQEKKSGNIEGDVTDVLVNASENDLKKYFKEISEQASDPNSQTMAIATFGENIVKKALELYPPEVPKESKISVIQPGEIKQPETITIKPKEDAVSERSAAPVVMDETSRNGETMGQGDAQPEIVAGAQEGVGQPETQGSPEGQEKVSSIHVEHPPTQLSFKGLQETANEFGFEDVKRRDRVSDIQERKNAEIETSKWVSEGTYQQNIDDLLTRIENRTLVPVARQRLILEQYLANEKQKARELPKNSEEYNRQLKKVERIKDIGTIARQEAGAALRIPDGGSLPHPILDEADAMIAKKRANAVDDLTEQQKAEVEAQVQKYKEAADNAESKVAKLEEQVAKIDAEKEIKKIKSTTKKTKKTAEERAAYRQAQIDAAREELRKLRSGESGLSAVPLPGVRELMAIAPHIKNIVVDLVEQGIDNLQEIVTHIHNEFKGDGLTEKNIHDIIAGEYNQKKEPLSELRQKVRDLQEEAKLINQIEALENGAPPKTEKAKRERNQKIKALRDQIKELKSEDGADKLRAIKKRNEEQAKKIKEKIAKGDFEKETKKSIFDREDVKSRHAELRKEALDAIATKEDAQHEFDLALLKDQMANRSRIEKAVDFLGKLIHTSKAIAAGIDDSATFIQNGLAMLANPKTGAKVWREHWKDAFSDKRFKRELAAIHERPDWEIIKKSKLDINEPSSAAGEKVEELFEKNLLAGKIKIGGKEFEPWKYTGGIFERAFISLGNNMRLALFEKRMQMLIDEGKTFESHPQEYKDAARAINELTGRGKLPEGVAQAAPWVTPFIWAPRMLTATINTLGLSDLVMGAKGKGYYQNLTPAQRKFALGQLGRGIGMGVAAMGAASLAGAKVDYDPRSVTFGDVIFGDHHYNVFGRFTPVVKAIVQVAGGVRTIKGKEQDLDNAKMGGKTRMGVVGGFFRGKMTPAAGAAYDLLEGKQYYTREDFGVEDLPEALIQPMSIKDLREGWKNDGTWSILNRFLPAFEGMKVSDERDFKKAKSGGSSGGAGASRTLHKRVNKKIKHH